MAPSGGPSEPGDAHTAVTQELLVRYLDAWTPAALHSGRRITYLSDAADGSAVAALRVFGEFTDRLAGRRITVSVLAEPVRSALVAVHSELGSPAELVVAAAAGDLEAALRPALGAPLFAYLVRPPEEPVLAALGGNKNTEVLLSLDPAGAAAALVDRTRSALAAAGLTTAGHVELVDAAGAGRLLIFATAAAKHLEKFKDELWAVDEFAGVRYRDPRDGGQTLVDISLAPDLGPLRRLVLRHLAATGPRSVADLRRFTLQETLYRPADATRLLTSLVSGGALARDPERGRLTAETVIRVAGHHRPQ